MMANGPSRLSLGGGTQPAAPPFHFLARSYAPCWRLGAKVELNLLRMGFYPAGGGEIEARIWPAADQLEPFDLITRGAPAPVMPNAMRRRCRARRAARAGTPGRSVGLDRGSVARGRHAPARRTGQRAAGDLGARAGLRGIHALRRQGPDCRNGGPGTGAGRAPTWTATRRWDRTWRTSGRCRWPWPYGGAASRRSTPAPS